MLEQITPLILTYNEAPNIARTLGQLSWARDIVVVDSFSDDETLSIVARFPQVRMFQRRFDTHQKQWNFGLAETGIASEWVLALDADYLLTGEVIEELRGLTLADEINGYRANFVYCINENPLRASAYPPVTVLFRREKSFYQQDGHTQRVYVDGKVENLRAPIMHDDRKPIGHWLQSQARYMKIEARKLTECDPSSLNWADRLRKMRVVAPLAMLFYVLIVKRAILEGRAGLFYAFQRTTAELILSLYLIEGDMCHARHRHREKASEKKSPPADLRNEVKEQG